MQREITQEIRQRIFALYWGVKCLVFNDEGQYKPGVCYEVDGSFDEYTFLELKDLKDITDEDAIKVASIVLRREVLPLEILRWDWRLVIVTKREESILDSSVILEWTVCIDFDGCKIRFICNHIRENSVGVQNMECPNILTAYHYLYSQGYALPFDDLTVQELIDAGVYRLKTKES